MEGGCWVLSNAIRLQLAFRNLYCWSPEADQYEENMVTGCWQHVHSATGAACLELREF